MRVFFLLIFSFLLFSCTTNANIQVEQDNSSIFTFDTTLSDGLSSIIRSFTGVGASQSVFNEDSIRKGFSSPTLSDIQVISSNSSNVEIKGMAANVQSLVPVGSQPISVKALSSGTELVMTINEQTMGSLFSLIGEDSLLYMELLQAPLFTGEDMQADEYLSFIGALYGESIAKEMEKSVIHFEVEGAGEIHFASVEPSSVGSVEWEGKKALFSVSLYKFLSNTNEIFFRIQWNN